MLSKRPKNAGFKVTAEDMDNMFVAYCNKEPLDRIAKRFSVSGTTIHRYKKENDWEKKRQKRWEKAEEKADDKYAEARARQINLAKMLQHKGLGRLKTLKDSDISAAETRNFIKDGIQIERELTGDVKDDTIVINVTLPERYKDV